MVLLYCWLSDYRNIKKQGFNFSSEFRFEFSKNSENDYTLIVDRNPDFIEGFFGYPNISEVTAIVGENGSGKSNVLDFIKGTVPEGNSTVASESIIAIKSNNECFILVSDKINHELKFKLKDNTGVFKYLVYDDGDVEFALDHEGSIHNSCIFYSNIFGRKVEDYNFMGLYDISVDALIVSDTENTFKTSGQSDPSVSSYRANEIRRNLEFLISDYRSLIDFKIPEFLRISVLDYDLNALISDGIADKGQLAVPLPDIEHLAEMFDTYKRSLGSSFKEIVIHNLWVSGFFNFIRNDRQFSSIRFFEEIVPPRVIDHPRVFITQFFTYVNEKKFSTIRSDYHSNKIQNIIDLIKQFEKLIDHEVIILNQLTDSISFQVEKASFNEIVSFLNCYIQAKGSTEFLDFDWRDLSSGEQSKFSFYSRFYQVKKNPQNNGLTNEILILIDEGDICFHPEWQKSFFDMTLKFLTKLFPENKLQLIFTSNTPFITSDLPKSNVIFLKRAEDNSVFVFEQNNIKHQTFAANIHTLLSDSFYLNNSLIGDFARAKIKSILEYISNKDSVLDPIKKKEIDLIGEPILKRKILELWHEKFEDEEEIEQLQTRIDYLKTKKKDDKGRKDS